MEPVGAMPAAKLVMPFIASGADRHGVGRVRERARTDRHRAGRGCNRIASDGDGPRLRRLRGTSDRP